MAVIHGGNRYLCVRCAVAVNVSGSGQCVLMWRVFIGSVLFMWRPMEFGVLIMLD